MSRQFAKACGPIFFGNGSESFSSRVTTVGPTKTILAVEPIGSMNAIFAKLIILPLGRLTQFLVQLAAVERRKGIFATMLEVSTFVIND